MKNVSTLRSQSSSQSPKTPGGISKSLLTPCRRVGLSRSWKKSGVSPFVSPISGSPSLPEVLEVKKETRKRKERVNEEDTTENKTTPIVSSNKLEIITKKVSAVEKESTDLTGTPSRSHVELPRKKKSKTLLSALNKADQHNEIPIENDTTNSHVVTNEDEKISKVTSVNKVIEEKEDPVKLLKPVKLKSLSKNSPSSNNYKANLENKPVIEPDNLNSKELQGKISKETSPKELTKKCIVVIQKKIFKNIDKTETPSVTKNKPNINIISQDILDSDSDDVPLCHFNKNEEAVTKKDLTKNIDEDNAFDEPKTKPKINKLSTKKTSTGNIKVTSKNIKEPKQDQPPSKLESKSSVMSFDDDDDFDLSNKKTILIKKTYKVEKPLKAKSTGSITQKDIDDLKARIETKKKMLLAKAMTEDTAELRCLIKKWQKGCQDALAELMDLMKSKFPDKQNMDYSDMLQMLKIPAPLVGYDSDNDCFNTPDDASIILSKFND